MKKTLALVLALVMALALVACGSAQKDLAFTTGGDQGTYYAFGGVMAQKISETTKTKVTAITSGGSKANIEALQAKDAQFGFVQSDVMAYAYGGTRLFEKAVTDFSTVAAMYMEQVQIVTLDPAIKTVADLKGKNVSIGAAGSGVYFNAIDVLGAYGLAETDINPTYQSFGDSVEAPAGRQDRRGLRRGRRAHQRGDLAGDHQEGLPGEPGRGPHRRAGGRVPLLHQVCDPRRRLRPG